MKGGTEQREGREGINRGNLGWRVGLSERREVVSEGKRSARKECRDGRSKERESK